LAGTNLLRTNRPPYLCLIIGDPLAAFKFGERPFSSDREYVASIRT
jgi:hypothetical protein